MKVLVDTHVALWALSGDPRLSRRGRAILDGSVSASRFLSLASVYEIAVKVSIGKLALGKPLPALYAAFATDLGLVQLPISSAHCVALATLPMHHRDQFDRMLVAQAREEGLALVTADPLLSAYDVRIEW